MNILLVLSNIFGFFKAYRQDAYFVLLILGIIRLVVWFIKNHINSTKDSIKKLETDFTKELSTNTKLLASGIDEVERKVTAMHKRLDEEQKDRRSRDEEQGKQIAVIINEVSNIKGSLKEVRKKVFNGA